MRNENQVLVTPYCGLSRRLAAMLYDSLLLISLFFFGTIVILPFTGGQAISSGNIAYNIYLIIISYLYFTWQWTHGGQTLGMRAWHIRLQQHNTRNVTWWKATTRFFLAILSFLGLGLGFIWSWFDLGKLAFHDRFSNTFLIIDND
ncbi:MAG: hypothetical protein HW411_496 [Gammaproteobacteria bacterium]|nr:hypothetical protein [Gammaproteobacteria bacterium]